MEYDSESTCLLCSKMKANVCSYVYIMCLRKSCCSSQYINWIHKKACPILKQANHLLVIRICRIKWTLPSWVTPSRNRVVFFLCKKGSAPCVVCPISSATYLPIIDFIHLFAVYRPICCHTLLRINSRIVPWTHSKAAIWYSRYHIVIF